MIFLYLLYVNVDQILELKIHLIVKNILSHNKIFNINEPYCTCKSTNFETKKKILNISNMIIISSYKTLCVSVPGAREGPDPDPGEQPGGRRGF